MEIRAFGFVAAPISTREVYKQDAGKVKSLDYRPPRSHPRSLLHFHNSLYPEMSNFLWAGIHEAATASQARYASNPEMSTYIDSPTKAMLTFATLRRRDRVDHWPQ